jgi:hypothetical protein
MMYIVYNKAGLFERGISHQCLIVIPFYGVVFSAFPWYNKIVLEEEA